MEQPAEERVDAVLRDARALVEATDAEWLLAHALGRSRTWLFTHGDAMVDPLVRARYDALVERRARGEPVAYLTGSRGFWTLGLQVTPDTLIPRADTELLVELALERLPGDCDLRVADLGTGSGAIALALASERPRATVLATDASDAALSVARRNAAALGIESIAFVLGDWCGALGRTTFDLIASNPPYLADDDPHRWAGDLRFEPVAALVSGSDGLDALRSIARDAPSHLVAGGWLLLEHGWKQGEAVRRLLADAGFVDVATEQDLEHRDRVTLGRTCR